MNNSPFLCTQHSFQEIMEDLEQWGQKQHEQLIIVNKEGGYYPKTMSNNMIRKTSRSRKNSTRDETTTKIITFFNKNILLTTSYVSNLKSLLRRVRQIGITIEEDQQFETLIDQVLKVAGQQELLIHNQHIQTNLKELKQDFLQLFSFTQTSLSKLNLDMTKMTQVIKHSIEYSFNCIIKCKNGENIPCNLHYLAYQIESDKTQLRIPFFFNYLHHEQLQTKPSSIDLQRYPELKYSCNLTSHSASTIRHLLSYIFSPSSIEHIHSFADLFDLYVLCDFILFTELKNLLEAKLQIRIDTQPEHLLRICNNSFLPPTPFIIEQLQKIGTQYQPPLESFYEIPLDNFLLWLDSQYKSANYDPIFQLAFMWLQNHAHFYNQSIQQVLYEKINDKEIINHLNLTLLSKPILQKLIEDDLLEKNHALMLLRNLYFNPSLHSKKKIAIEEKCHLQMINTETLQVSWDISKKLIDKILTEGSFTLSSAYFYMQGQRIAIICGRAYDLKGNLGIRIYTPLLYESFTLFYSEHYTAFHHSYNLTLEDIDKWPNRPNNNIRDGLDSFLENSRQFKKFMNAATINNINCNLQIISPNMNFMDYLKKQVQPPHIDNRASLAYGYFLPKDHLDSFLDWTYEGEFNVVIHLSNISK